MDRQFWICQKSTKHEPLVLIEVQGNLNTSTRERKEQPSRIEEARAGVGKVEVSRRPSWRSFWHPQLFSWPRQPTLSMKWLSFKLHYCVCRQCQDRLAQLQRSHTPSNLPSSHILCNPTGVDPLTYTLPSNAPMVPPPKNVFEMQENRNHNAGTRYDSPIPISPTNTWCDRCLLITKTLESPQSL